jgi:transcriptional regulator with XRE-family HTH domain
MQLPLYMDRSQCILALRWTDMPVQIYLEERHVTLLAWRKYRRLSQEGLAAEAKVSKTTVNRLENYPNHRVRGDKLKAIATALGIEVNDLLDRDPPTTMGSRAVSVSEDAVKGELTEPTAEDGGPTSPATMQAWTELKSRDIRERFEMNERHENRAVEPGHEEPSATTRIHLQKVLERGLSLDQVEALLFVTMVEHFALLYERGLSERQHEHRSQANALRERFAQVITDAELLAPIMFFQEYTGGGDLLIRTWYRDLTADGVRATLEAVERWECAYGRTLDSWIGAGPWWDATFEKSFADRLEGHAVRLGLIPPSTLPPAPSE